MRVEVTTHLLPLGGMLCNRTTVVNTPSEKKSAFGTAIQPKVFCVRLTFDQHNEQPWHGEPACLNRFMHRFLIAQVGNLLHFVLITRADSRR